MIEIQGLGFAYPNGRQVLADVSLSIEPGELALVVGPSGSGKSTLLRCLNGLIPHFHGGELTGRVLVDGMDTRTRPPRDLARVVGMVFQDPESQIVAETVEDEIAFGMENLGLESTALRKRVEEALDQLHIAHLRGRRLDTLSGGELQRVAIAAVLAMQPRALLLDEPTSQLDPQSAEELLTAVQRLNDDLGLTVVIAEHRLERVAQYADRVLHVPGDGSVRPLDVRGAMATLPAAPPVSRVGRALGWAPLPLSVREGRRLAAGFAVPAKPPPANGRTAEPVAISARGVSVEYDGYPALTDVTLEARRGEIVALMGRNGAGKTTLLRALVGLTAAKAGDIDVLELDPRSVETEGMAKAVALVPQEPSAALYHRTVAEEIADALSGTGREGAVGAALAEWQLAGLREANPLDLSVGERQRTALAALLVGRPQAILLDEPTRGMDHETKDLLVSNLRERCRDGAAAVIASHDVELVARCADRVVLLAEGQVVVEGPVRTVLTDSLTFSTQVNKLFGGTYLTPEDVLGAEAGT